MPEFYEAFTDVFIFLVLDQWRDSFFSLVCNEGQWHLIWGAVCKYKPIPFATRIEFMAHNQNPFVNARNKATVSQTPNVVQLVSVQQRESRNKNNHDNWDLV